MGRISNIDLLNTLRLNKNSSFHGRIPEATQENMETILAAIEKYTPMKNEMSGELVSKIGLMVFNDFADFVNPLAIFKKGDLPYGKTIEEVYMELLPAQKFDQKLSETEVLKREIPKIKTLYHSENVELYYKTTIDWKRMRQATLSEFGIFDYLLSIFTKRCFDSDALDEYLLMKHSLDTVVAEAIKPASKVRVIEIDPTDMTDEQFSKAMAKAIRSTVKQLTFYNTSTLSGIENTVSTANQTIIMTPEIEAEVDVDVLAFAIDKSKAEPHNRICIIDQFASEDILAVIASDNLLQQYDTYVQLEPDVYNPQGLYRQVFFHHHGVYSFSKFANIVVIKLKKSDVAGRQAMSAPSRKDTLLAMFDEKGLDLPEKQTITELEKALKDAGDETTSEPTV